MYGKVTVETIIVLQLLAGQPGVLNASRAACSAISNTETSLGARLGVNAGALDDPLVRTQIH